MSLQSDSTSNHSLQSTSKFNHSIQRLAMSLKKKQKQRKHILLDDNQYDDDDDDGDNDDDEIGFSQYTQIDDDDNNEILINNNNLSPPPRNGHVRYPSDPQPNAIRIHQKSRSMGRFPESYRHKSSFSDNHNELSHSYESKSKPTTVTSPSGINPASLVMSPLNKATTIDSQQKKKTPPPIPPKPKERNKCVIPNTYPGTPTRHSSISNKTIIDNKQTLNNDDHDNPLKVNNTKLSDLSNLKITPINQSTTSLSSTNLADGHRHSGYYFDNEDAFQQLDETFTNITDEMENFPDDNDSDQDIFNNGKVKRRSKFKYLHQIH